MSPGVNTKNGLKCRLQASHDGVVGHHTKGVKHIDNIGKLALQWSLVRRGLLERQRYSSDR